MKSFRIAKSVAIAVLLSQAVGSSACFAQETGQRLQFKKPSQAAHGSRVNQANLKFRSPSERQPVNPAVEVDRTSYVQPTAQAKPSKKSTSIKRRRKIVSAQAAKKKVVRRDRQVVAVVDAVVVDHGVEYEPEPEAFADIPMDYEGYDAYGGGCDSCTGGCTGEVGCGMTDPSCGFEGPSCGCAEPGCGICEPGCGLVEPSCGLGATNCGSCVGAPGKDYWCFPVCLPRFKDLSVWAGVHGFRGPRDFSNGRSDSNFGFQEGINISGRAPLLGLLFPQLSYQLGYQATQSRLSGTVDSADDRTQQFVTGGFFRRVKTGLQFGVVWDMLRDDLDREVDYHQVRTEISLKSPRGREFGFWSTTSTNENIILGTTYETVDMYALFYRWNFGKSYQCRLWGGATDDGEGIFGGEFQAPLSDRLSVVSEFNYLITDKDAGLVGVQEEAWNVGINLVWHMGRTARRGCRSPYRPLFAVANNGWMIVDNVGP
ncbi:MAG: hypothetical protein GXP28_09780 [Planctomycetes bacterium]|nr:hypothetical protein [Planctomycetota bacterium]